MLRHAYPNMLSDKVNAHSVRAQILFGLQESQGRERAESAVGLLTRGELKIYYQTSLNI